MKAFARSIELVVVCWVVLVAPLGNCSARAGALEDLAREGHEYIPERQQAHAALVETRERVLKELFDIARTIESEPQMEGPRLLSIQLLGTYRVTDPDVLDWLVANVELWLYSPGTENHALLGFACAEALCEIGWPSLRAIEKRLASGSEVTENQAQLFAHVAEQVAGRDAAHDWSRRILSHSPGYGPLSERKNWIQRALEVRQWSFERREPEYSKQDGNR